MLNKNLFNRGDVVAVALSGGKDSVCLFHLLLANAKDLGITVKAINVEHGIRGEQSKSDSLFVEKLCKSLQVPLKTFSFDCIKYSKDNGMTVEEGARKFRYQSFLGLINEGFCDKVATAHHLSDNVETVLLNLFRGASPSGIKGIPEIAYEGKIIRPILQATREEIDGYVANKNLEYVVDESNKSDDYSRNFLRLNVIPKIKERFPEMERAVGRFVGVLLEEDEFMSKLAIQAVEKKDGVVSVLTRLDIPVFARACVIAMKECGIAKDYDKTHIDGLLALKTAPNGKRISLLNGVVGVKEYDRVAFYKKEDVDFIETNFFLGEIGFGRDKIAVEVCEETPNLKAVNKGELYFDLDKIPDGAVIRTRRNGDVFTKFGGGTKKLGDYMTDKKIPLLKRDSLPLIVKDNVVLVICGREISELVKIDKNTRKIAKITVK
ncbi:MAG: tRNA lysidine(34) synthetase TilS [Clostridia bacterium]|nr:tRNA lysidine(34) synthetase TilS [Clostridia bacterium]